MTAAAGAEPNDDDPIKPAPAPRTEILPRDFGSV